MRIEKLFNIKCFFLLWALQGCALLLLIWVQYWSLEFATFDTGIYANQLSNLIERGELWSSVLKKHPLSNHFTPNLFILTPLYAVVDSFVLLPIVKVCAFLAVPWILVCIGREVLGKSSWLVWIAPCMWLTNRYVLKTMLFEFQVSSLALPFIALAFLFALRKHWIPLFINLLFLLGFKEHLALMWIAIGLFLVVEQRNTKGGLLIGAGCAIGLFIYTVIMPYFGTGAELSHSYRFGPFALLSSKVNLLMKAFLSVGFLPLFSWRAMVWLLPTFGLAFVSNDPNMVSLNYHYQDLPLTVMFVALIFGLQKFQLLRNSTIHARYLPLIIALLILVYNNRTPGTTIRKMWPIDSERAVVRALHMLAPRVKPTCTVIVQDALGPYLTQIKNLEILARKDTFLMAPSPKLLILSPQAAAWPLTDVEITALAKNTPLTNGLNLISEGDCLIPPPPLS
jgi:uncharacterized membrane protein